MPLDPFLICYLLFAAAVSALCLWLIDYVWRQYSSAGTIPLIALILAIGLWSLTLLAQSLVADVDWLLLWLPVQELGRTALGSATLALALQLSRHKDRSQLAALLVVVPSTLTFALVLTNPWHELWYTRPLLLQFGPLPALQLEVGLVNRFFQAYRFITFGAGMLMLGHSYWRMPAPRQRLLWVTLLGAGLACAGMLGIRLAEALNLYRTPPLVELATLAIAPVSVLCGILWLPSLRLIPIAKSRLLEELRDGVIVLDTTAAVVDINSTAAQILERPPEMLLMRPSSQVFPSWPLQLNPPPQKIEIARVRQGTGSTARSYEIRAFPLHGPGGLPLGTLLRLIDVTSQERAEAAITDTLLQEQRRVQELRALQETMTDISAMLDLDALLSTIVRRVVELLNADSGALRQVTPATDELALWAGHRLEPELLEFPAPRMGQGIQGTVAATRTAMIVNDLRGWPDRRVALPTALTPHAAMATPLIAGEELIAVLAVFSYHERHFSAHDLDLMKLCAQQATIAIQNARLYTTAQYLATTDGLTNTWTRRHFLGLLERERQRSQRYPAPLSVAMFDVDHFKQINDTYGHLIGDQVLAELVERCRSVVRQIDVLSRYGGEEFAICFPQTELVGACQIAERLRHIVAAQPFLIAGRTLTVTISIGLAESLPGDRDRTEQLLDRADQALYAAKHAGRNQVWFWSDPADEPLPCDELIPDGI